MRHVIACAVALLAATSCFDLSVPPYVSDAGPAVAFVTPADGGTISLSTFVQLQVVSLNGVAGVSLLCTVDGGYTGLDSWPGGQNFEATVDFSSCSRGQNVQNVGTEQLIPLQLEALAIDDNGNLGTQSIDVSLDVSAPVLTIQAPPRVGPNATLTLDIQSNRPLAGPPTVTVQGIPATVSGDAAGLNFVATLSPTPPLGAGALDGGADGGVSIDALEAVELPLPISIDAHDRQNGNLTHVSYQVLLSRLLWQKPIPGALSGISDNGPCLGIPQPVAASSGVQLPLMTGALLPPNNIPSCVGGLMAAEDGTFIGPPMAFLDGGVSMVGFDHANHAVYFDGQSAWYVDSASGTVDQQVSGAQGFEPYLNALGSGGLLPVGNTGMCALVPTADAGVCVTDAVCLSVGSATPSAERVSSIMGMNTSFSASNGDLALWGFASCVCSLANCPVGSDVIIGDPLSAPPVLAASAIAGSLSTSFQPLANSDFLAFFTTSQGLQTYAELNTLAVVSNPWNVPSTLMPFGTFPDGRVVTLRTSEGFTIFEAWDPGGTSPAASFSLPGLFAVPIINPAVGLTVSSSTTLAALLNANGDGLTFVPAILVFDHSLTPQWLYRYPTNTSQLQLFLDPSGQLLYIVDSNDALVTAAPL